MFLGVVAVASAAAVGCFVQQPIDDTDTSGSKVTEGRSSSSTLLKSTLLFADACSGVKVGPKQILTAARCVQTSTSLVKGGTLRYVLGSQGRPSEARAARTPDASAEENEERATGFREATIADVHVNPSFASRCREDSCAFGSLVSSDAADIAVIELAEELSTVPSIPVDLDPVGVGDPLFVTMSECALLDSTAGNTVLNRTPAVPTTSVVHAGSPYEQNTSLVSRLGKSYLLTAGPGWDEEAPGFCRDDVGGPVFRTNASVVVGVTAGYTAWKNDKNVPVTLHHTRLDEASKEAVGTWLKDLGVETIKSCSESIEGCKTHSFDGGVPRMPGTTAGEEGDGGTIDGGTTEAKRPPRPEQGSLEIDEPEERSPSSASYEEVDGGSKKKAAAAGGCSAAPGNAGADLPAAFGLVSALALVLGRRRANKKA